MLPLLKRLPLPASLSLLCGATLAPQWLNSIVMEVWPYVDKAVCRIVKIAAEKSCDEALKNAKFAIKKAGFKQLTFGEAPFRIESERRQGLREQGTIGKDLESRGVQLARVLGAAGAPELQ